MMERSFTDGEVLFFSTDAVLVRMLTALCGVSGAYRPDIRPKLCIADEEESCRTRCMEAARAQRAAVLLLGGETSPVSYLPLYHLPRPFVFSDFWGILRQVAAPATQSPPSPARKTDNPFLRLETGDWMCWGDNRCHLTPSEAQVLRLLMEASPEPVSRQTLSAVFAGKQGNGVDVYISYLRRKLKEITSHVGIVSVRGQGYALLGGETIKK